MKLHQSCLLISNQIKKRRKLKTKPESFSIVAVVSQRASVRLCVFGLYVVPMILSDHIENSNERINEWTNEKKKNKLKNDGMKERNKRDIDEKKGLTTTATITKIWSVLVSVCANMV